MAAPSKRPSAKEMIAAIEEAQGFVMKAVDLLGISRASFYNYLKNMPTVQQALDDQREKRHQWVESKLMKAVGEDNLTAIIFYLKTQGKHLGYIERQELQHSGDLEVRTITIKKAKKADAD